MTNTTTTNVTILDCYFWIIRKKISRSFIQLLLRYYCAYRNTGMVRSHISPGTVPVELHH